MGPSYAPGGPPLRSAACPSSCSSISTGSSTAARIPCRASPPSSPRGSQPATTSSYVTNNSMHYRADYVTRLTAMGAPVTPDRVISSSRATALHVRDHEPAIRRVLAVGAGGLERELRDVGLDVVTAAAAATRMTQEPIDGMAAAGSPDAVIVGLDPNLTYLRLTAAADCIRAGARFIATNRDPVYPTERGLRPGAGRSSPPLRPRPASSRCPSASRRRSCWRSPPRRWAVMSGTRS